MVLPEWQVTVFSRMPQYAENDLSLSWIDSEVGLEVLDQNS